MAPRLTSEMLAHAYEYLRVSPPFDSWNLPHAEDVTFRVVSDRNRYGWFECDGEKNIIAISKVFTGHTSTLLATMAHELIHLHMHENCIKGSEHGRAFKKLAAKVAQCHGFDLMAF